MPLDGVKNIILVLSGKGGVGKSSLTLQLALALSLQGRSVGILDVDLTGPSIPRLIGMEDAKITQAPGGWVPVLVHDTGAICVPGRELTGNGVASEDKDVARLCEMAEEKDQNNATETELIYHSSLRCMSLGFLLRDRGDAVIWRGPKKTAMVQQFLTDVSWGETDYLLIDTPPGTSDEHIVLAQQLLILAPPDVATPPLTAADSPRPRLAGGLLITTPQAVATADVRKEINFCMKTGIPALGVIENFSGYQCPCCGEITKPFSSGGGEVMALQAGLPFLGNVPVDVKFGSMVEHKRVPDDEVNEVKNEEESINDDDSPLVQRYLDCPSHLIFERFAKSLIAKIEGVQGNQTTESSSSSAY